jgi:hypothetical protein
MLAIPPIIGAIRGASCSKGKLSAAVMGGAIWGGVQGGIYAAAILTMGIMKSGVLFYALVALELNLIIGAGVGFLVGVGFRITGARAT